MEGVYNLRSNAQLDQIIRYLDLGDVDNAIRAVGLDPVAFLPWDKGIRGSFEAAGTAVGMAVPAIVEGDGFRSVFQFNVRNPVAERWLSERSSLQIVEILTDQRTMIRAFLTEGMASGTNPRTVALDLVGRVDPLTGRREGGVIGLTETQSQWVRNYERELRENPLLSLDRALRDKRFDGLVRRAGAEGAEPLTETQIGNMVRTYSNRALRYRAENIARTEALTSLHQGQQQAMEQAITAGVDVSSGTGIWRATHDDRTRDSHAFMDGQERPWGEPFMDGDGNALLYPGDPTAPPETTINCRCWLEPNIDFLEGVE
jgi:hypothetical protein